MQNLSNEHQVAQNALNSLHDQIKLATDTLDKLTQEIYENRTTLATIDSEAEKVRLDLAKRKLELDVRQDALLVREQRISQIEQRLPRNSGLLNL